MEFDVSRVYTAVNADELKVGSKVIVADTLQELKRFVEEDDITTLDSVDNESVIYRFRTPDFLYHGLAYLVEPPEEKKLKWTDLKIGDVIRSKDGIFTRMVIGIDKTSEGVEAGLNWLTNEELREYEKVEDNNG